ncbi:hypothetical protein RN001_007825 [Aquatica leii]|uniref:Uncharacterized protein n=1 Tax=Aquatica leii TaxID=1421715 RepID=A0AAN7PWW7_9COLE|nr:hypothetical protein RN001_007825 [Aquatica leii]
MSSWDRKGPFTEKELGETVANLSNSEDDLEITSDEEDVLPKYSPDKTYTFIENLNEIDTSEALFDFENISIFFANENIDIENLPSTSYQEEPSTSRQEEQYDDSSQEEIFASENVDENENVPTKTLEKERKPRLKRGKCGKNRKSLRQETTKRKTINLIDMTSKKLKEKYANINWRKGNLQIPEAAIQFYGNAALSSVFMDMNTPLDFVKHFFTDTLYSAVAEQSNLYSSQTVPEHPENFTLLDIKKYVERIDDDLQMHQRNNFSAIALDVFPSPSTTFTSTRQKNDDCAKG